MRSLLTIPVDDDPDVTDLAQPTAICCRYILYDFDREVLASTRVYESYTEAVDDAAQFQNVLVLPLDIEGCSAEEEQPAVADADPTDAAGHQQ